MTQKNTLQEASKDTEMGTGGVIDVIYGVARGEGPHFGIFGTRQWERNPMNRSRSPV